MLHSEPVVRVCQRCVTHLKTLNEQTSHRVAQNTTALKRPALPEIAKLPAAWDTI